MATGILWMMSVWALFGDDVPTESEAGGFVKRLYDLGDAAGKPAVGATILFAAYMLGSILTVSANSATFQAGRIWHAVTKSRSHALSTPETMRREFSMSRWVQAELAQRIWADLPWMENMTMGRRDGATFEFMHLLLADINQLDTRLHAKNQDLYQEYDRRAAEAALRINVGLSVAILSISLAFSFTSWCLFGLTLSAAFVALGVHRSRQSNDVIIQALLIRVIESPVLEGQHPHVVMMRNQVTEELAQTGRVATAS
ncbi:hypothetical protein ACFWOX_14630 [Streptomyces sp. NPDC058467]|uniref:hypothetical protein n=1 Tax=Streptomyces sp. NPDC058467 TaxID=3346513 RepID=UPI00364DF322